MGHAAQHDSEATTEAYVAGVLMAVAPIGRLRSMHGLLRLLRLLIRAQLIR
jgi:hypothetical protein